MTEAECKQKGDIEGVDRTRFLSTPFMCLIIN